MLTLKINQFCFKVLVFVACYIKYPIYFGVFILHVVTLLKSSILITVLRIPLGFPAISFKNSFIYPFIDLEPPLRFAKEIEPSVQC